MIVDYHMHTLADVYGKHEPVEYIKIAKEKNLDEIGFSEHFHIKPKYYSLKYKQLPEYIKMVQSLKNTAGIPLKLGIEMDFVPGLEEEIRKIIESNPFDYIIGSVHFIGNWDFDNPEKISSYDKWDLYKLYQVYFNMIKQAAKSKLFNIIGHIDLIKIFGFKPKRDISNLLEDTIEILGKCNVCIEVNTSGLRKPCREIYPSEKLLKMSFDKGVQITLGSDAHKPEDVGRDFDKAIFLIRKVGYKKIATFENRKMKLVELG
jgi:histidinol-phosphatase (PHP family)